MYVSFVSGPRLKHLNLRSRSQEIELSTPLRSAEPKEESAFSCIHVDRKAGVSQNDDFVKIPHTGRRIRCVVVIASSSHACNQVGVPISVAEFQKSETLQKEQMKDRDIDLRSETTASDQYAPHRRCKSAEAKEESVSECIRVSGDRVREREPQIERYANWRLCKNTIQR